MKAKRLALKFAEIKNNLRGHVESQRNTQGVFNRIKQFLPAPVRALRRMAVGDTVSPWREQPVLRWGIAAVVIITASSSLACGPWFPNNMLDRGDSVVLVAPVADFYSELASIPASPTSVRAIVSTSSYAEDTLQAELTDLRAALNAAGKSSNEVERIVLGHAEQRAKLQKVVSALAEWKEGDDGSGRKSFA